MKGAKSPLRVQSTRFSNFFKVRKSASAGRKDFFDTLSAPRHAARGAWYRSELLKTGFDLADHVKRAVAEDDAVPARMLHRQPDTVRDDVAGCDGLAELGQVLCQLVRVQRAGIARRDGDELLRVGRDVPVHAVIVLVGQNAGEDGQRAIRQIILNVLDERLNALRVVSAVDDEQRVFAPHVEPARPADIRKVPR